MRVNTTDLQNAFGKYLALVEKRILLSLKRKSVAKLVPIADRFSYSPRGSKRLQIYPEN